MSKHALLRILFIIISLFIGGDSTPVLAQNSDSPDLEGAKAIAKEFSEQLLQTKDVTPLLDKYFTSKPKFFPYGFAEIIGEEDWTAEISDEMRYQLGIKLLNFGWVAALYISKATIEDDLSIDKRFPADAMSLIRENEILSPLLSDDGSINFISLQHLQQFIEALVPVTNALREYLNRHPESWKPYFSKWASLMSMGLGYETKCRGEDCFGLPDNTEIYTMDAFPFVLLIIKENGIFKIAAIEALTI